MAKDLGNPPQSSPSAATPAANTNLLYGILLLTAVGIGVSIYLLRHKLHITLDPTYTSSCNLGGAINCDKVNVSGASELFGLPISFYGIPTYLVQLYLTVLALRGRTSHDLAKVGEKALDAVAGIGLLTSGYSLFLALYSSAVVEAYCLYCISLYIVNFGVTALAIAAGPKTVANTIQRSLALLVSFDQPVTTALLVLVIGAGGGWLGYDHSRASLEAEYKAKIDAAFAGGDQALKADAGSPSTAQAGANNVAPQAAQVAQAPAARPTGECGKPMGKKTEDGWTIYEPCLDEEDIRDAYGAKDAKVTVVKYSDFECPYCRYLAMTMEPLKPKYKDKVRFIMKHFPMNPSCNKYMAGYDKHPNTCFAHAAALCAGRQGKFWDMHDKLYANQPKLDAETDRKAAEELGLDMAKYDACLKDPSVQAKFNKDIDAAYAAGIYGAPRTYINGRMVTGSASTAILEYYIQKALENPTSAAAQQPVAMAPKPDGSHMIAAKTSKGAFYIDAYEAAVTKDGKAVSLPDVEPAIASWTEATDACAKAGKRLCSEEEWVSACAGALQVDNNNNQQFADDDVEGNMYPYGTFYEAGTCVDQEDKYKGKAQKTGAKANCRTPSGLFDLAGNMGEWSGVTKETAGLMGGHNNSGERAACNQRSASFGVGNRNQTTGFRCCADKDVAQGKVSASDLKGGDTDMVGKPVPAFKAKDSNGQEIDSAQFKGKVTLVNFFASWCGPCKKEFPELVNLQKEHKAKGFQVISIGVDREEGRSLEFAKGFEAPWGIIADAENELMGKFNVYSMPATFLVDRQGVVRFYDTGFKPEEQLQKLRDAIASLL
ncbi:MAG: redoxin family protein [Deltaproteobacteria bacterium]|nr:redoxin family protein [Deltaproteobacteria bacterium]